MTRSRPPEYYISYVVDSQCRHSFIVLSKRSKGQTSPEIIGSFGLYGRDDTFVRHIISYGFLSEPGKIRSEVFYDRSLYPRPDDSKVVPLIGKSFPISDKTMENIVIQVCYESTLDRKRKSKEQIKQIQGKKGLFQHRDSKTLTDDENLFRKWFINALNYNLQGGPRFNGRDFNCHKYALYILNLAGIRDHELESFNFPPGSNDLKPFNLNNTNNLNIENPSAVVVSNAEYDNMFYSQETAFNGAIALLKDYAEAPFHFKRHYKKEVSGVLEDIKNSPVKYPDIQAIIAAIGRAVPPHRYYGGSLQRRLDYLKIHEAETQEQFNAKAKDTNLVSVHVVKTR